jgi:hypothetical protein
MARKNGSTASKSRSTSAKTLLNKLPSVGARGGLSFRKISRMKSTRFIATGIAAYGLVRLAMRVLDSYPQVGEFFSDNMNSVEGKFREWTGLEETSDIVDARH